MNVGLLKELKQLPGLMKKERTAQSLVLGLLALISKKSGSFDKYVAYCTDFFADLVARASLFVKHNRYYRTCQKDDLNYYLFSEIEREVADMRKVAQCTFVELAAIDWSSIPKQQKKSLASVIADALRVGLYKLKETGFALELAAEEEELLALHQRILDSF